MTQQAMLAGSTASGGYSAGAASNAAEVKLSREGVYFLLPAEHPDDLEDDYSESRPNGQHQANDISAEEGTSVYSVTSGTVVEVFVDSGGPTF